MSIHILIAIIKLKSIIMRQYIYLVAALLVFSTTGCSLLSSEDETKNPIQHQIDSLKAINAKSNREFNNLLQLINDIQSGIDEIKTAEGLVSVKSDGELSGTSGKDITDDIALLSTKLKENKDKLARLQAKLNSENTLSAELKITIENLNKIIEENTSKIIALQQELKDRDVMIEGLDKAVASLTEANTSQSAVIDSQDIELNRVYYLFGTRKELREQGIVNRWGNEFMEGDYSLDYFTTTDKRDLSRIALGSKGADLLSKHPKGSYIIDKDKNGVLTFTINDKSQFWSLTKYLVIEVK